MPARTVAASLLTIFMAMAHAAEDEATPLSGQGLNGSVLQEMYGGVVADQTVTVAGHEFYQYFVALWRDKELSNRYAISVHERPSARWGSQIWIEYAQRRMFHAYLPPARANVKAISQEAVEIAFQKVVDTEVERLMFREPDLGADEM